MAQDNEKVVPQDERNQITQELEEIVGGPLDGDKVAFMVIGGDEDGEVDLDTFVEFLARKSDED